MRTTHFAMGSMLLLAACGKGGDAADTTATAEVGPATTAPATPDAAAATPDAAAATPDAAAATPDAAAVPPDAAAATDVATGPAKYYRARIEMPGDLVVTANVTLRGETGTMDIPLQHLEKAPVAKAVANDSEIAFSFQPPGAPPGVELRFSAKKNADKPGFSGEVDQMGMKLPLTVEALASEADFALKRPQTPQPPFAYKTEEVKVPVAGAELACTLSLPEGAGPHPAMVFFSGSGAQDRDETIFEHKPFLVLSDALVKAGIATLRCDDRGVGGSTGTMQGADLAIFAADGKAEVDFLAARADIDKAHIGALGHSEGGMVVGQLGKDAGLAFVVTLSGPARSGREVSLHQNMQTLASQGVPADKMGDIEKALDALFTAVADDKDDPELQTKADALADAVIAAKKADDPQEMPPKEALAGHFMKLAQDPWLKSWVKAKPAAALAALKVPVLALFGEKDSQVPGEDHAVVLKKAFDGAKKKNGEVELIAGANHLFQAAATGKLSEYETIEETMQPTVIERITTWVKKQVGK